MEDAEIRKYYKIGISGCIVNIIACIIIIAMLVAAYRADLAINPYYYEGPAYYVGVGVATFYLIISGLGMVFALLSLTAFAEKIPIRKGFGIAMFVIFVSGMFIMLAATILVAIGL
ncbi:MAG: hypothetical protein RBG13Loki_3120, partial [Promethearchaeota archaeon CR_4]